MDFNYLHAEREIWVYGFSNMGRNAYNKLNSLFNDNVKGILVTKHNTTSLKAIEKQGKNIVEISRTSIDNAIIIIATNRIHHESIKKILKNKGCKNILIYNSLMDDWLNSQLSDLPLLETRFLGTSVGQACNLKCRDCANFSPYANQENMRYDIENIKRDMLNILPLFSVIDTLHIQGGEPFIYSDLDKLLVFIEQNFHNIDNIQIATNGMIIPNEKVIKILEHKREKYTIRISNYRNAEESKKLMLLLKEYNIVYKIYNFAGKRGKWSHSGELNYKVPEQENVLEKTLHCAWNSCYTIENGVLGRCARSIPARSLQRIEIKDSDYLNLKQKLSVKDAGKYFMFIEPMDCCKYCKGSNGEPIEAAVQLGK